MNTATFAKTVGLSKYHKPMIIESKKEDWGWNPLFTHGKMTAGTWQTYQHTGFGSANLTGELQPVQFEPAYELDPIVLTAIKMTKGFMISEELEDDNVQIPNLLGNFARSVGRGHRYAVSVCTASLFNNAFSSSYTGWDDVELCGSHTTNDGTTIDNDGGPSSLDYDTLWDAIKYFSYQIFDEAGLPVSDTPKYLVCHPSQQDTVEAILKSPGRYDNANNEANTLKTKELTPIYNRLQTSTTAWFLVGEEQINYFHFLKKKALATKWKDAFENIGKKCRTHQRFAYGFSDYRFCYGDPGA